MSLLTKADLKQLGIPPGEVFGKIFKATKNLSKQEAIEVAKQIHNNTWNPVKVQSAKLGPNSVWVFIVTHPSLSGESRSGIRRMIEQGAIRLNWANDWKPEDDMPSVITELTLFPSGARKTTLWCLTCQGKGSSCGGHVSA